MYNLYIITMNAHIYIVCMCRKNEDLEVITPKRKWKDNSFDSPTQQPAILLLWSSSGFHQMPWAFLWNPPLDAPSGFPLLAIVSEVVAARGSSLL